MLRAVFKKIINKIQLNLCLFLGVVLLVAVAVCHPLLLYGGESLILKTEFEKNITENNQYPILSRNGRYKADKDKTTSGYYNGLDAYRDKWLENISLPVMASQNILRLPFSLAADDLGDLNINLFINSERNMSEHISIIKGTGLEKADIREYDGNIMYPCLVSAETADEARIVIGERIYYRFQLDDDGRDIEFYVAGIYENADVNDLYWMNDYTRVTDGIWVLPETMDDILARFTVDVIAFEQNVALDYTKITPDNADRYLSCLNQFAEDDHLLSTRLITILSSYARQAKSAEIILFTFELPCILLLIMFIFMVSQRIAAAEQNEIAVWRSRGIKRPQVMCMYLLQSIFLAIPGCIAGTALGYGLCCLTGSKLFTTDSFVYAVIACAVSVICILLSVYKKTGVTVVNLKSNGKLGKKSVISRFFPELFLLAIALYLLYNYSKQLDELAKGIREGKIVDPIVFICGSLFIFASGLLVIRICGYIVDFIYKVGRRRLKAVSYSAILQVKRTFREATLLSVFLVMTIAGGVFNAGLISTVDIANSERVQYNIGADFRVSEHWKSKKYVINGETVCSYEEPDFDRFKKLMEDGVVENVARVKRSSSVTLTVDKDSIADCMYMSIIADEFGHTAELKDGLNDTHWYNMLNSLALEPNGAIITANVADRLGLKIGDRFSVIGNNASQKETKVNLVVAAVVDAFPAYIRYAYNENEEGGLDESEKFMIVTNLAMDRYVFDMSPYEVWCSLPNGSEQSDFAAVLESYNIKPESLVSLSLEQEAVNNAALISVIKSMVTISMIISGIISVAGFMIYWIISIKSRELLFGVYRAMGMHMSGVSRILFTEITFCSLLPALAAIGIGTLTAKLFVGLTAVACLPEKHIIALEVKFDPVFFSLLGAILFVVFIFCYMLLKLGIRSMNISKAIKLGED